MAQDEGIVMDIGTVTKYASVVFLFLIGLGSLALYGYDLLHNAPIPAIVDTVIGSSIGFCFTVLGINHGSVATQEGVALGRSIAHVGNVSAGGSTLPEEPTSVPTS